MLHKWRFGRDNESKEVGDTMAALSISSGSTVRSVGLQATVNTYLPSEMNELQ